MTFVGEGSLLQIGAGKRAAYGYWFVRLGSERPGWTRAAWFSGIAWWTRAACATPLARIKEKEEDRDWLGLPSGMGERHPNGYTHGRLAESTGSKISFLMPKSTQVRLGSQGFGVSGSFAKYGLALPFRILWDPVPHNERPCAK